MIINEGATSRAFSAVLPETEMNYAIPKMLAYKKQKG